MEKKHYLFHLGHPAHYQLFKNIIKLLSQEGHQVSIVIKKKDILESLLERDGLHFKNLLPTGRKNSKFGIFVGMIKTDINLLGYCIKYRPNLMIGTSYAISHIGKLLSIPSINVNEDDWDAVPFYAKFSYPWASVILTPNTCKTGKWENKTTKYDGYHELAYLHPNRFNPELNIASKYVNVSKPYFLLRFASLKAHHDKGVRGLSNEIAWVLINILREEGNIYITSERPLSPDFEKYRLVINPLDIYHVMAFANLYIGDSQTMAAEAGILGIPFVRYSDFVGKLGYLNELETKYELGFGFRPHQIEEMLNTVRGILKNSYREKEWTKKRSLMLTDKIDVTAFMVWFIENYPESDRIMKENPDYQYNFK
jgi:uncharacterized protein